MQNLNHKRETFAISDPSATSYAAADILSDDAHEKISYKSKNGWFVARWQAITIGVLIFFMLLLATHIGRFTGQTNNNAKKILTYNSHYVKSFEDPEIPPVTPVPAARISAHTNLTTEGLTDDMRYLVEPINYILYLQPLFESSSTKENTFTFCGNVSITLHVREEIKYLVIGASDLRIISTGLHKITNSTDDATHKIEENIGLSIDSYDVFEGTLNFELYDWLQPGQIYELIIEFNGDIHELPYGLFRSHYEDPKTGELRWMVATNLDIPFARTVFPCFDAPTQLATFQLNIARQESMRIQGSTMYWQNNHDQDNMWYWDKYMKTAPIPVHSLAFVVNNFENVNTKTPQISHFAIWTVTNHSEELQYVLETGPLLIRDIGIYLGIALPVKKINIYGLPQVLPRQKAKVGMIYMSESDLIVKENQTSAKHKQNVAQLLAGHLIEQWIENLITFQWRHDDWIKEALVQYFEYAVLKFVEPRWGTMEQFLVNVQQIEMDREVADPNRKPLYVRWVPLVEESKMQFLYPINETTVFQSKTRPQVTMSRKESEGFKSNPNIYTQLYEKKISDKGACMIRMIKHMITEPLFIAALRIFLDSGRERVVDGEDLWNIMTDETTTTSYPGYQLLPEGVSLQVVLEDWLYTEGYPLITVTRNYDNGTITFSQHIRTANNQPWQRSRLILWHIPISYTTKIEKFFTATAPRFWLNKVKAVDILTPKSLTTSDWILVNPQQTNFYRVLYDKNNWGLLREALKNGEFPATVRAQLIDDALFFGRKGMLDYEFALEFTRFLSDYKEKEYIVWMTVLRHLKYIRNVLLASEKLLRLSNKPYWGGVVSENSTDTFNRFMDYTKWLITPPFNNLNSQWKEFHYLNHNEKLLRSDVFLWACASGISECNVIARSEFDKWKNMQAPHLENPIEADMRYAILCSIMRVGGSSDYDFLLNRYLNTSDTDAEKYTYLKSLYCYHDEKQFKEFLATTLDEDYSVDHLHKVTMLWSAIPESFYISAAPFDFMIENWYLIEDRFSEFTTIMKTIVEAATSNLHEEEQLNKLKELKNANINDLPYLTHTFDDAIRNLEERTEWTLKQKGTFLNWLHKNSMMTN